MSVNPDIQRLFPEKTEREILNNVHNPCEDCDFYEGECHCKNFCTVGRLWEYFLKKEGIKR